MFQVEIEGDSYVKKCDFDSFFKLSQVLILLAFWIPETYNYDTTKNRHKALK